MFQVDFLFPHPVPPPPPPLDKIYHDAFIYQTYLKRTATPMTEAGTLVPAVTQVTPDTAQALHQGTAD
jgi:hypothetical protein